MLKITRNSAYYTIDKDAIISKRAADLKAISPVPPIPKISTSDKIPFHMWCEKHKNDISNILEIFQEGLHKMQSEKYVSHMNMAAIKHQFITTLYETSDNSFKRFI
jgi:hypothetical protein